MTLIDFVQSSSIIRIPKSFSQESFRYKVDMSNWLVKASIKREIKLEESGEAENNFYI